MGFSAENTQLWQPVLQLGYLALVMLAANFLQRKVSLIRRSLLPTAVLGGFVALIVRSFGLVPIDTGFMENITYHTIALGFIALGLRMPKSEKHSVQRRDGVRSGMLIVATYLLQGLIGLAITITLGYTLYPDLFKAAGILLPMGYGQGPGQANNIGTTYEVTYGFAGGASFGLATATMGFLWACIGGVICMNYLRKKKGLVLSREDREQTTVTVEHFQDKGEIPMSESVDRLTMQAVLVVAVYLVTYLVSLGITSGLSVIPALGSFAVTLSSLIWGFNFIIGSLLAALVRNLFIVMKKKNVMTRQYPNNYLLNRISGMVFDLMIISAISTIDIYDLSGLWVPFLAMCTIGGAVTLMYLYWICKYLYPDYFYEGFFSMYGMLTGTVSTGILLLREVDAHFATPATNNLITGSGFAIAFGFPMLILVGLAPQSTPALFISLGLIAVYCGVLHFFLLKGRLKKRK